VTLRWGVLGATSRIHRQRLRPAFGLAGQRIVAEASRRGDDLSAYGEVLADPAVDAVYIPLPNALHVERVARALEAGKHVLCEKPLTMTGPDTAALFTLAERAGRHLSEAFMWPHHPRAVRLGELVVGNLNAVLPEPHAWTPAERRSAAAFAGIVGQLLGLAARESVSATERNGRSG